VVAIELRGVSKRFRLRTVQPHTTLKSALVEKVLGRKRAGAETGFQALTDVTLSVEKGQTLGIVGRNGSGKSTLLKLLTGIFRPDSGRVQVNGKVSALLELGAGFHPEFTGRENVFINGIVLGLSKREVLRRFDEIVRFAELEAFIDEPVRTYSSGMYMRLGFAVAVHTDPDILLIDEVLAVGDEAFQKKCYEKIAEFQRKGRTIVLVSHDLRAVEEWCDEVIWLEDGAVRRKGAPGEVVAAYLGEIAGGQGPAGGPVEEASEPASAGESPCRETDGAAAVDSGSGPGPGRWGSREVEIASVRLLDRHGDERSVYDADEALTAEISYRVNRAVGEAVFGIAILREDGLWCYGTNTDIENIPVPALGAGGIVEVILDRLGLIEGRYYLDVAVHPREGEPYDYQSRLHPFSVGSAVKDVGVFRVPHRWVFRPELRRDA
jgi:ABC-type polysaccharide/polyol phosphate transport system ATPase subunit